MISPTFKRKSEIMSMTNGSYPSSSVDVTVNQVIVSTHKKSNCMLHHIEWSYCTLTGKYNQSTYSQCMKRKYIVACKTYHKEILPQIWISTINICFGLVRFMVFNVTFNNIFAISWRQVLLVKETGVTGENHRQPYNVVSSTPRQKRGF